MPVNGLMKPIPITGIRRIRPETGIQKSAEDSEQSAHGKGA